MFLPSTSVTTPLTVNVAPFAPARAVEIGTVSGSGTRMVYAKVATALSTPSFTALTFRVTASFTVKLVPSVQVVPSSVL